MSVGAKIIQADVVVLGAGIIGSAVAMSLAKLGVSKVVVLDLDLSGEWSSSELNAGGVRATWSQKVNLLTSRHSIEYFETVAEQVGYRPCGYLWMHRPETFKAALKAREMHVASGWQVDVLDVQALKKKVPFIDKTDDLAGALYGVRDGLLNPNRLKEHYREEAQNHGVQFLDGMWVVASDSKQSANQISKTTIKAFQFHEALSSTEKKQLLIQNPKNEDLFDANRSFTNRECGRSMG